MNRKKKRSLLHNLKKLKGLRKSKTSGAFGKPLKYIMNIKKKKWKQKAKKFAENELKNQEKPQDIVVDTK